MQVQSFVATAINNCLNSPDEFPRVCLFQRLRDMKNRADDTNGPKLDTRLKPINPKSFVNSKFFWENLMTTLGTIKFQDKTIHLHIDEKNEGKVEVLETQYHPDEAFKMITYQDRETIPVYTDGSVYTKTISYLNQERICRISCLLLRWLTIKLVICNVWKTDTHKCRTFCH